MRALSIKQYWLYAITNLGKKIENRSWPPHINVIGQRIALHASKAIDSHSRGEIYRICPDVALIPAGVPVGAVIATAVIAGYVEQGGSSDKWFVGPYGWILRDVVKLDEPIKCKGFLGLWFVPHDVEAEIKRQLFRDGVRRGEAD